MIDFAQSRISSNDRTISEQYLDLLKRTLTRAIFARSHERHTLRAQVPGKRQLIALINRTLSQLNLELVRVVRTSAEDYLESGHAATNRAEDAETMLGTRQLDQMQACITDVVQTRGARRLP